MELMAGYKQTDVGVIPDDWDAVFLGQLCSFRTGPFGSALHKSDYTTGGIPLINPMHIVDGQLVPNNSMTITAESARKLSDFLLRKGDIVIGRRGDMGRCAVVGATEDGWLCGTGSMIVRTGPHADPAFLQRILSSPAVIAKIEDSSVGSTMINLNQGTLRGILVQAPPFPEQRAIADALSDVDAQISALESLIAKKRNIKQATMQQLLTGKTRLPGFKGEWRTDHLDAICSMKSGEQITTAKIDQFSKYPCFGGNGLRGFTTRFTHEGRYSLIGRQGALCGNVLGVEGRFFASEHAIVVAPSEQTDIGWLTFVLGEMRLNQYSESSAQPGLSVAKLLALEVMIPPTKAEQTAIASVLSDMDVEVEALEAKRDKVRALKQGMMQELLTGRIRLV